MPYANRFLVVELDPDLRFFYSRDLRRVFPDCSIIEVESCQGALARLGESPVDAVVVNQAATDAKGPEILRRLHAQFPHLPLISIGESALKRDAFQAGAVAFVEASKSHELGAAVRNALNQRQVTEPKAS